MNEETAHGTEEFLKKRLSAIKNQRSTGELEDLALVIGELLLINSFFGSSIPYFDTDGKSLTFALEKELSKTFLELAIMCKAVICCTYLPLLRRCR